jgi:SNF2 family DNA or RNA helicase
MIHISHLTKSIVVPSRPDVATLFPHSKRFTWNGGEHIAIPHGIDETIMLRNLDFPIPAPIAEHYEFPSADGLRPFEKQVLTCVLMTMHRRAYVLNDMGVGKTKSAIWAFDFLRRVGKAKRMLVVAPLSTLVFTWQREFMMTLPMMKVVVLTGSAERRRRLLKEPADVYVVNHDGLRVVEKEIGMRPDIDVFCFDEAAAYRNARAERSKLALKLSRMREYVWAMTGSPTPSGPTDAFGLARLITPDTAPRSFVQFRQDTMIPVNQFKWVPRNDAKETVARLLQPSVRFSLDEVTELPPLIERFVEVEMGTRQRATYDAIRDYASAMLKEGTITAANGGVVFSKMLQVSCGWVYSDKDRQVIPLDNTYRLQALLDIIAASERKLIVFSPFKSATAGIAEVLKKEKIDFATVTGDTPHKERTETFNNFQHTTSVRVINAHPECMSHGLTLTAADTIVWFGPVTKLETFSQANARISRVGQLHKQQILKLVSSPAERMVYKRLEGKRDLQEGVLDLIAELAGQQ